LSTSLWAQLLSFYGSFYQVIGPYRSGKSFLLNQLLSLSCYEGVSFIATRFYPQYPNFGIVLVLMFG